MMASRRLFINLKQATGIRLCCKYNPVLIHRSCNTLSSSLKISVNYFPLIISHFRHYAKGKDKLKNSARKVEIREDMLAEHVNVTKLKMELKEAVETMREQYIQNVSLRSSAGSIEGLQIEFEGEKYTVRDLAQINRRNPKVLALNFSVFPQTIPTVLQALSDSGMNLNPQQDGTSVYIPIPKVTREHRENLAKSATAIFNKSKISIKDIGTKYVKRLEVKQNEGLSSELFFNLRDQITQLVNNYVSQAETMKNDKLKELLENS